MAGHTGGEDIHATNLTDEDHTFLEQYDDQLSRSTKRAKWIHLPEEHEDRPGQTLATRNHEVIQRWAGERDGQSATVPGTEYGDRPGVLRFDFPGYGGQDLKHISWDDWFKSFDERNLVFLYQEHKTNGDPSTFFQLESPERAQD